MVEMHADDRNELDCAQAGDIIAIVGMKNVQTGHTLCDPKASSHSSQWYSQLQLSLSLLRLKIKPAAEKMGLAIGKDGC